MAELPDVGSIQPLTEAEKRRAFGTPLTRALKIDPISVQRDPIKRGIASIGSNMLDMLPGFSFKKGLEEEDPIQMGFGVVDLIPGAALLKVASKPVSDLANKLAKMSPDEIAAVRQQYNPIFKNIDEQQERIYNTPNALNSEKDAAREIQRKVRANYSIMFDNAGKKYQSNLKNLKKEGFDIDKPLFHGTKKPFEEFDPTKIGQKDKGFYGKGFYLSPLKEEAKMYGPAVGKFYTKGNILNLGGTSEIQRVLKTYDKDAYAMLDPNQVYKEWAGKLNSIDALPPVQKRAYNDFLKAEEYYKKNRQVEVTSKSPNENLPGGYQDVYKVKIKDPDTGEELVYKNVDDLDDYFEVFEADMIGSATFPDLQNTSKTLSYMMRDLDQKELYEEGIEDVSKYVSEKVKKAGYDGINAGSEVVIFDKKNIKSAFAKGGPVDKPLYDDQRMI